MKKPKSYGGISDIARILAGMKVPLSEAAIRRHIIKAEIKKTDRGYSIPAVLSAIQAHRKEDNNPASSQGLTGERERKTKLEADLLQLELDQQAGKLMPVEHVNEEFGACSSAIKTDMLALASSLPGRLEGLAAVDISEILRESITEALRHCAQVLMDTK